MHGSEWLSLQKLIDCENKPRPILYQTVSCVVYKHKRNCQSCCQITRILKILKSFLLIQQTLYILTHPFQLLNTSDGLKNTICVLFASVGRLGHYKQSLSCLAQGYAWNYICVKSSTRDKTWTRENNFIS